MRVKVFCTNDNRYLVSSVHVYSILCSVCCSQQYISLFFIEKEDTRYSCPPFLVEGFTNIECYLHLLEGTCLLYYMRCNVVNNVFDFLYGF